ncbi:uncharacterized protein LOC126322424 [Schistocerca gregaria]|uniref:uncharacterized protein LOC126322424 n=1 Tax=Schistocerca gregaria TaxID=7010 RepID=UPI00211EC51E|nr:uncharacterized protein LOC126322424 [Schistocerca gregaria]
MYPYTTSALSGRKKASKVKKKDSRRVAVAKKPSSKVEDDAPCFDSPEDLPLVSNRVELTESGGSMVSEATLPPVDLGLNSYSRKVLSRPSIDMISAYMEEAHAQDGPEALNRLKHKASVKVSKSFIEQEDVTVRRIRDILVMPVLGPPLRKIERSVDLPPDLNDYFEKYPRTHHSYNALIWKLSQRGNYSEAKRMLESMKEHNLKPNIQNYTSLLLGCRKTKDTKEMESLLNQMRSEGLELDQYVFGTVVDICVESGALDKAFEYVNTFKQLQIKPNAEVFTSLIKGCIRDNDIDRAWKVYHHMRTWHCEPDEITIALMIYACARRSETEKAMQLYREMKSMGIRPTGSTYDSLLYACLRRRDYYSQAFEILKQMKSEGVQPDAKTLSSVLGVCAKGGDVPTAELLFDEIIELPGGSNSEYPYAYMIEAYSMAHRIPSEKENFKKYLSKGELVFERMLSAGVKPTSHSLNMRLLLYTKPCFLNRAVEWKNSFRKVYHVEPNVYTYNLLIAMYAQAHRMEIALDQFHLMKAEGLTPQFTTYQELIKGCTKNHMYNTGMKILREMKKNDIQLLPEYPFIMNFRRLLVRTPHLIREIDKLTGKAYRYVPPWRKPGRSRKIVYGRQLSKEERKRSPLYG